MFYGCSHPPVSPPKYTNPLIAAEWDAAKEMIKNDTKFNYHSTKDRIPDGAVTASSKEYYSLDGIKVTEDYADYKSAEEAQNALNEIVEKLKDFQVVEQHTESFNNEHTIIAIESNNKLTPRIVSFGKTSVYVVSAPTLRYAFAYLGWLRKTTKL